MTCTRCQGTGFLNAEQIPDGLLDKGVEAVEAWIEEMRPREFACNCAAEKRPPCPDCDLAHDVAVCDCCGDGSDWYGTPGEHFAGDDQRGPNGPYAYNGGLPECN